MGGVELLLSGLCGLDDLSQAHLVGLREQGKATGLVQIEAEEVGTGAHGAPGSAAREIVHCNEVTSQLAGLFHKEPQCGTCHISRPSYYPLPAAAHLVCADCAKQFTSA